MGCLNESGVSDVLGPKMVAEVEKQIKSLVLATDITRQQEFLSRLKEYLDTDTLDMDDPEVRHFWLQIALKCADISNPCRPWDISRKWSLKVCEEFFRQGDYERQLNLPITALCDRYSSSVPKIQTGFYQFVVRPLFAEWHRMLGTPLSTYMMGNLDTNEKKWEQLLKDEIQAKEAQVETSDAEELELPAGEGEDRGDLSNNARSVRFDPMTTITTASDSEGSETEEDAKLRGAERPGGFLGIPGHPGRDRRHSIATGLMGNIQLPPSALLSTIGGSSQSGSTLSISDLVASSRTVARTVIRRESLPGTVGRALPTKTILHLQRLSAKQQSSDTSSAGSSTGGATAGSPSHGDFGDAPASPIRIVSSAEKSSCSSCSTTDEILDFTYSLPETGSRSSGSPRRILHDTTDLDELCPGTSILSMSPNVAHVTLQQSTDLEDQRRHLIRQQTCPVVSVTDGSGNFNRPRFLSAAAAISPTAVASSSIITQHRSRNRSPETGGEDTGRCSGGSSSEALICCEVISEEADRQSGGSSAEASPLEIFVQQFPPPGDDNDGEAPRRESLDQDTQSDISYIKEGRTGSLDSSSYSYTEISKELRKSSVDSDFNATDDYDDFSKGVIKEADDSNRDERLPDSASAPKQTTFDNSTQTDLVAQDEEVSVSEEDSSSFHKEFFRQAASVSSPPVSGNKSRLGTSRLWRHQKQWKSLTEDENEEPQDLEDDDKILQSYYNTCARQKTQGGWQHGRRGSAPVMSIAQVSVQEKWLERAHYHSNTSLNTSITNLTSITDFTVPSDAMVQSKNSVFRRRGSAPLDPQQVLLKPMPLNANLANIPRMGRRGSLPVETTGIDSSYAYKRVHGPSQDEASVAMLKRRNSGGSDLSPLHQHKWSSSYMNLGAWKAQILIEKCPTPASPTPGSYWQGRRRGSLPNNVFIASSGSCTSESESLSGDVSDT